MSFPSMIGSYTFNPTATEWQPNTAYAVGDRVYPQGWNGYVYKCTTAGTSDDTEPFWLDTVGDTTEEDTGVKWETELFTSVTWNAPPAPTASEKEACYGWTLSPAGKFKNPSISWKKNAAVLFACTYYNEDCGSALLDSLQVGETIDVSVQGSTTGTLNFPGMVIKSVSVKGREITINAVDPISIILNETLTLDTLWNNEYLKRKDDYNWESEHLIYYTKSFVNGVETVVGNFNPPLSNNWETTTVLPPDSTVLLISKVSSNVMLDSFLNKLDGFGTDWDLESNLRAHTIYHNIMCEKSQPLRVIQEFIEAEGGYYYIYYNDTDSQWKLVLKRNERISPADWYFPPALWREEASYQNTEVKRFNKIYVINDAIITTPYDTAEVRVDQDYDSSSPLTIYFDRTAVESSIILFKKSPLDEGGRDAKNGEIDSYINETTTGGVTVCDGINVTVDFT